jgi:hypothetical protein
VTGLQVGAYNVVCCLLWPYSETCVQKLLSRKQNFALIKVEKWSTVLLPSKLEHDPGIIKIKSRPAPQMFINGICVESWWSTKHYVSALIQKKKKAKKNDFASLNLINITINLEQVIKAGW